MTDPGRWSRIVRSAPPRLCSLAHRASVDAGDIAPSVHDGIDKRRILAMPCSDLRPTGNVGVAGFVSGGAGAAAPGCRRPAAGGQSPSIMVSTCRHLAVVQRAM